MVLLQVRHVQDPPYGTGNQDASYGGVCYSEDLEYLQYDKDSLVRARINNDWQSQSGKKTTSITAKPQQTREQE